MAEKKEAYYFSHDANARNDIKILRLRMKHKAEGYGLYFMLIEVLREQKEYKLLLSDIPNIAFDLRCSEGVLNSVINDFDLFTINETTFYSPRLVNSMGEYNSRRQQQIEAGRRGGQASVKQRSSDPKAKVKRPSTIKVNEMKVNEMKGNNNSPEASIKDKIFTEEKYQLKAAHDLFRLMKKNNTAHKEPDFQKWAHEIDKIERIDGHSPSQIYRVLHFSQWEDFWKKTCHSPASLRKHFIKIHGKAEGYTINATTGEVYKTPNNEDELGNPRPVA